jgi:membrane protein implicated in regulation of membrane protease activity
MPTITWIIVAALSLTFAFIGASFIHVTIGESIGNFSFGVILVARWTVSGLMAANYEATIREEESAELESVNQ